MYLNKMKGKAICEFEGIIIFLRNSAARANERRRRISCGWEGKCADSDQKCPSIFFSFKYSDNVIIYASFLTT